MKEFTLQLAKDSSFKDEDIVGAAVTSGNNKEQTLSFKDVTDKDKTIELKYSLSDITANPDTAGDSSGRVRFQDLLLLRVREERKLGPSALQV